MPIWAVRWLKGCVAPHAGAWIEIKKSHKLKKYFLRRPPRGGVG